MQDTTRDVTQLLVNWSNGDQGAREQLLPLVYDELRKRARGFLRMERAGHSLNGTALVHEAYLRLVDQKSVDWHNRAQFFGLASQVMRHILVDHARRKHRLKRGGEAVRLQISDVVEIATVPRDVDLLKLDNALEALAKLDPEQARIVELRYFTGLSIEETAEVMGVSPATVKRHWTMARMWLLREMGG
jgi:RNA polymerase sigma factor (TIGR02999 family)